MISGIDIACWDIKAQALGVPIYELLGGEVRENIPLYTHFQYADYRRGDGRERGRRGRARVAGDQDRPVHRRPADLSNTTYIDGQIERSVENTGVAMIEGIRKAVGPDIEVLIDAHALYNVPTAVRLANRLAPVRHHLVRGAVPARELRRARGGPQSGSDADLRRRAAVYALRVPAGPQPPPDGLRHAGRDLDRGHLRTEEDRDAGRDVLHPDLAARCQRPGQSDRRRPGDADARRTSTGWKRGG